MTNDCAAPGRLFVVGLGPGDTALLAPAAKNALETAKVVVGYSTYLDLLPQELLAGKEVVRGRMMGEVERCAAAVDAAAAGRDTAVISSGDAGIYGMAGLVLETLEARGLLDSVPWEIIPGIPALAGAAARLGAPLMHDFAVVSLSDLLTPRELIMRRIEAAAGADFVLVIYNPRSKRRADILGEALDAVRRHRSASTPVGLVRNAWRDGEEILVEELGAFDPARVDMLSILVIGNNSTRARPAAPGTSGRSVMLTPRGYEGKYEIG